MSEMKTKFETAGEITERFLNTAKSGLSGFFSNFSKTTADTIGWLAIIIIHAATIPGLLAVKAGITDSMPPLELVAFLWIGLLLYFIRSAIIKDMLNVITIGVGFAIQALLLGFIFFV
jgi:hypothetical protein